MPTKRQRASSKTLIGPAILAGGSALNCITLCIRRGITTFWWTPLAVELVRLAITIFFIFILLRTKGEDAERDKVIDFASIALLVTSLFADFEVSAAISRF